MLFVLRPGARGWHMLCEEGMVSVAGARDPPRTRAAGGLRAGIDLAPAIGIGAGIEGGLQHIVQSHAVGPTPLQWPFDRAFPQAYSELHIVLDQVTQERMQCPEFLTFAKDQPDHMLDLGIRIIDDLAGGVVDIPNRQREAQCTPARLLQGALIHALLEDMKFRLTHSPFASS